MTDNLLCSDISRQVGEPLFGTASHANVWLFLEYNRPWAAKATEENELPATVKEWLTQQLQGIKNGRLQFIRQLIPTNEPTFWVLIAHETSPRLYHFSLTSYDGLLSLDIQSLLADATGSHPALVAQPSPLYLICTNAKRDKCCGVYGAALYRQLLESPVAAQVWQTTHLGGHRFAPTLMTLPDGVYYGRISPADLSTFITTTQQGHLYLPAYRGRTCYPEPVQAAEYHLRQTTGQLQTNELCLISALKTGDEWQVVFEGGGEMKQVVMQETAVSLPIYASCGKPETKPIPHYTLLNSQSFLK